MTGILGYARVSTSDQDVAGQSMRLTQAGAIKVFTNVRSGRNMDRPGLQELLAERTRDGIAAARARGKRPGRQPLDATRIATAVKLVAAGLTPTDTARQLGLGRSIAYREVRRAGIQRSPEFTQFAARGEDSFPASPSD